MRILSICNEDHANYSYTNAQALREFADVTALKLTPHPFGYEEELPIADVETMQDLLDNTGFDIVQFTHSDVDLLDKLKIPKGVKKVVYYTGTKYRNDPNTYRELFSHFDLEIAAMPKFLNTGVKHYIGITIDVNNYIPDCEYKGGVIAHYPSNPEVKGTKEILEMFPECITGEKVSHAENLKRMNECDVYIELYKPMLNGKPYGNFGTTALEAAALGKVVFTQWSNSYLVHYREPFMYDDMQEWGGTIPSEKMLKPLKECSRKWVEDNHSIEATGERLKKIYGLLGEATAV